MPDRPACLPRLYALTRHAEAEAGDLLPIRFAELLELAALRAADAREEAAAP
jgi:hypothetical protein